MLITTSHSYMLSIGPFTAFRVLKCNKRLQLPPLILGAGFVHISIHFFRFSWCIGGYWVFTRMEQRKRTGCIYEWGNIPIQNKKLGLRGHYMRAEGGANIAPSLRWSLRCSGRNPPLATNFFLCSFVDCGLVYTIQNIPSLCLFRIPRPQIVTIYSGPNTTTPSELRAPIRDASCSNTQACFVSVGQ